MNTQASAPATYVVEASGWDANENFFVEKTELEWTEGEKKIYLRHPVRNGAVLFVRLMGTDEHENGLPVAYEASRVTFCTQLRRFDILLMQMVPRTHSEMLAETSLK